MNSIVESTLSQRKAMPPAELKAILRDDCWAPEACHAVGVAALWNALEAAERGALAIAAEYWDVAVPYLVAALNSDAFLLRFAEARAEVFGQGLKPEQLSEGRRISVAFVEERLKELAARGAEAENEQLAQRIAILPLQWRLEYEAAIRVRQIGGVPDGRKPVRCMLMGPGFAALHGLTKTIKQYLDKLDVHASAAEVARREALYCFSELALPFVYHLTGQHGKALELLKALSTPAASGDQDEVMSAGSAMDARSSAQGLAIQINVGLGTAELKRLRCDPDVVFEHFQAALGAARLQKNSGLEFVPPGEMLRQNLSDLIDKRIDQLEQLRDWSRATRLAKVLALLDPTQERLSRIVEVFKKHAHWSVGENKDPTAAIDCLERAKVLAPDDSDIRIGLLNSLAGQMQELKEAGRDREAGACCMSMLDEIRSIEAVCGVSLEADARIGQMVNDCKRYAAISLMGILENLSSAVEDDWKARAHGYLAETAGMPDVPVAMIAGSRFYSEAIEYAQKENWAAAFMSAEKAVVQLPEMAEVKALFENIAAAAIVSLCEAGDVDRAEELALQAHQHLPESDVLLRVGAKISLRRLDIPKILSEDPEEIAHVIAILEARTGKVREVESQLEDAGRYAAVIDPALRIERHLANVARLVNRGKCATALKILDECEYSDTDLLRAEYLRSRALRFTGRPQDALVVIDALLKEHPHLLALNVERALVLSQCGRFDDAENLLQLCRESEDEDSSASELTIHLGMNAWRAGHWRDAASQLQLARMGRLPSIECAWIEAMALKRLGRDKEARVILAASLDKTGITAWEALVLRWMMGEVDDQALAAAPQTRVEKLEYHYWLGEASRMRGDIAAGRDLLLRCLADAGMAAHYEFQHAQALSNSGQI